MNPIVSVTIPGLSLLLKEHQSLCDVGGGGGTDGQAGRKVVTPHVRAGCYSGEE